MLEAKEFQHLGGLADPSSLTLSPRAAVAATLALTSAGAADAVIGAVTINAARNNAHARLLIAARGAYREAGRRHHRSSKLSQANGTKTFAELTSAVEVAGLSPVAWAGFYLAATNDRPAIPMEGVHGYNRGNAGRPGIGERKFYCRMALFLVALVFLGFAPSFYLRDIVPSYPRPNLSLPPSVLLHGGLFTLWMLVLIARLSWSRPDGATSI